MAYTKIKVTLIPGANPSVIVNRHKLSYKKGILWERKKNAGNPNFTFVALNGLDPVVFPNQSVTASRVTCDNTGAPGDYTYTLVVNFGKNDYNTTVVIHNPVHPLTHGGKPVIRNN